MKENAAGNAPPASSLAESLDLLRRAQAGDDHALNQFLDRYQDRLRRIVHILLGPSLRDLEASMDIVQETYIVALREIRDFEPQSHGAILSWLTQIARNRIGDAYRKRTTLKRDHAREARTADSTEGGGAIEALGRDSTPSQRVARDELTRIYDECVSDLSERHRDVVLWRDHGLHTWEELRERLDLPSVKAARSLYFRASQELKAALERRLGSSWQ